MKKLLIILISLLLLTSCSSTSSSNNDSSNEEVDINENTTDVSSNDTVDSNSTNTINTEDLASEYNNISINNDNNEEYIYISELLGIKATFNINEYRPLSKQEIIDKYHYAKDYYDEKHIGKLLYDGYSYYDLLLNSIDNNTIISLSISKPGLYTYKDILGQYTTKDIEDLIKQYEEKGYKDVKISINTIDLFDIEDNKTAILYISYIDTNNNQIYQYSIFITNKEYMGILNIVFINEDRFDKALKMFEGVKNIENE